MLKEIKAVLFDLDGTLEESAVEGGNVRDKSEESEISVDSNRTQKRSSKCGSFVCGCDVFNSNFCCGSKIIIEGASIGGSAISDGVVPATGACLFYIEV